MGKSSRALLSIFAGGLIVSLGLAFSGVGVPKEGEQAAEAPVASAEEAKATVEASCAACHGADLKGAAGPSLHNLDQKYDKDQIAEILKNGKGGMPAGLVPGMEEAVSDYLLTLK